MPQVYVTIAHSLNRDCPVVADYMDESVALGLIDCYEQGDMPSIKHMSIQLAPEGPFMAYDFLQRAWVLYDIPHVLH